jgi:hypothetical protein
MKKYVPNAEYVSLLSESSRKKTGLMILNSYKQKAYNFISGTVSLLTEYISEIIKIVSLYKPPQ